MWWAQGPLDWHCLCGSLGSSPEASHWVSWAGRLGRRGWRLEAQAHFLLAAQEAFQRLPGIQVTRLHQDSVSEWAPRRRTLCPAVGYCEGGRAGGQQGLRAPIVSCPPPPAFSVYLDKEVPAYLSLTWTGLLVCRGVEGPDNSEEALHWASRGDRGRVLCPLGPSLQDTGSGDSAGKERGEAVSQEKAFCLA